MSVLGDRLALALSAAALLFLVGVVYTGLTMPQRPQPTDYSLTIEASVEGDQVVAHGTTNLPEGARLSVVVDRLFRLQGSGTWQSARIGAEEVVVRDDRWHAEIPINEDEWVREVAERVGQSEIDRVEAVQSSLRATVVFSPLVPQVGFVWESMGAGFESLAKSESATESGGQWVITRHSLVDRPLPRDLHEQLLPSGLQGGND